MPISPSSLKNNNLNFLRFTLASLVLVSHAPELRDGTRRHELLTWVFGSISFGELAVAGFFLLSGYLIVASWLRKPALASYFEKRLRRIVPGFAVAFLLSVVLVGPFATRLPFAAYFSGLPYGQLGKQLLELRPPGVPGVFPGAPFPLLNGALYTIAYEARCYCLVALLGLAGLRWQKALWLLLLLVTLGLSFLPAQLHQVDFPGRYHLLDDPVTFVHLLTFFAAGACFQLFELTRWLRGRWALVAGGLVVIALFGSPSVANLVLATLGAYALFWLAFAPLAVLERFKRADDVSYGVYLYGWPVQSLLNFCLPAASLFVLLPAAFGVCCGLGYVSWRVVEKPWLKRATLKRHEPLQPA